MSTYEGLQGSLFSDEISTLLKRPEIKITGGSIAERCENALQRQEKLNQIIKDRVNLGTQEIQDAAIVYETLCKEHGEEYSSNEIGGRMYGLMMMGEILVAGRKLYPAPEGFRKVVSLYTNWEWSGPPRCGCTTTWSHYSCIDVVRWVLYECWEMRTVGEMFKRVKELFVGGLVPITPGHGKDMEKCFVQIVRTNNKIIQQARKYNQEINFPPVWPPKRKPGEGKGDGNFLQHTEKKGKKFLTTPA